MEESHLKGIELFGGLSRRERREVARVADEIDVAPGHALVREGEFAYEAFILEEGEVEVRHGDEVLATLQAGDVFGEMAALSGERRNASVVATQPTRVIVMTSRDFRTLANTVPDLGRRIRAAVEERSRAIVAEAEPA